MFCRACWWHRAALTLLHGPELAIRTDLKGKEGSQGVTANAMCDTVTVDIQNT
jgi:hypothetical protein